MLRRAIHPAPRPCDPRSRKRARFAALAAASAAVFLGNRPAHAITYTAADTFSLNPSGFTFSKATGIFGTQQVGSGIPGSANSNNALLWNGSAADYINLNPAGFSSSFATSLSGKQQVGYALVTGTIGAVNAILWNSSATNFTNLNPAGFTATHAYANSGSQQVGDGYGTPTGGNDNALLWTGSASSYVNLNPSGFTQSQATATDGAQQVGEGTSPTTGNENALLWSGSAALYVNLNPAGYTASLANGISGSQQVGSGYGTLTLYNEHALLWSGSAASYVDLNPANFTQSEALATNSVQQVGDGFGSATGSNVHAIVWAGSAASYTDLNGLVPGSATYSYATSIDIYGNIAGFAESATATYAVEWLAGDTYNIAANGTSWNSSQTWLSGIPTAGNDVLLISSDGQSRTITYTNPNPSLTLGTLTIDAINGGSMTLSQSQDSLNVAALYLGGSAIAPGGTGILTVNNTGTLSVAGTLKVWNSGRANIDIPLATVGNLSIVGNGIVNINGALAVNFGKPSNDPVAAIAGYLRTGYNGGTWTGTSGIISTSAAMGGASPLLSAGYADGNTDPGTSAAANQILIKYTLAGDANLDGSVNFTDLGIVGQHLNTTGNDWAHGNFTYDPTGLVSFTDLGIVGQNLNKLLPPPSGSTESLGGTTLNLDESASIQNTAVQLPEPSLTAFSILAAAGLVIRRRRANLQSS